MTKPKHTPGPWTYIDAEGYNTIEGQGETIAYVPSREDFRANSKTPEGQANRRLIAAAPDMLEALETFVNNFKEMKSLNWEEHELEKRRLIDSSISHYREVESLIRKARGES